MNNIDAAAARKILFKKYWSSEGWARNSSERISPSEFDLAKKAGVMFDPVDLDHDAVIASVRERVRQANRSEIARAFVASLSTRKLEWRSALSSYACALNLPRHRFISTNISCAICGEMLNDRAVDVSILNFERLKWGGVRHTSPIFEMFDLTWFAPPPDLRPAEADWNIFSSILKAVSALRAEARPSDLEASLKGLLPGNTAERRNVLAALSYCGILVPRDRPTFWGEYPPWAAREASPVSKNDWQYPLRWWRGADGVNWGAVKQWFPEMP